MATVELLRDDEGPAVTGPGVVRAGWGGSLLGVVHADPDAAPTTGDRVRLCFWPDGRVTVEAVEPRRTVLIRADADGSARRQTLAANVDVVAVVEGLLPEPDRNRIARLLALARASGAEPVVVLTKADLEPEAARIATELEADCGCPVLPVSSSLGHGLEPVRALFAGGHTVALLGPSGAGKSSLVNALTGATVMRVNALRRDGKGRHTTVTRELHPVAGGHVIDGPGLRSVGINSAAGLDDTFADITRLAAACRFADCGHAVEPGCAVIAAIGTGELLPSRLDSFRRLVAEGFRQELRRDARLRHDEVRRRRVLHKSLRRAGQAPPERGYW
ncbi:ribosome small subunit-dependent GTPase A [Kineosporia sp. J2-2]|uniref:Small ribosomal subunit biogenesis GTPase RsgA n=1 Tax=Kineosporia corallincola TaxID=2835133 RepID=A0ABS5TGE5_9ACTN|nr:ribosome small subunit-dependent GTPase A [Kineosporia corallincola]MBT0769153.1 ribosome small subunit-dependent GTPase A [Kineosporia corallincola]